MDFSKVGEKLLSSVRSARSLSLLPSTSDRPERYYFATAKELMQLNGTTKSLVANHLAESIARTTPLKEDCKMQLTLELTHEKSCRILDTLVLEALRGVNIKEPENFLPKTSDVFLSDDVKTACSVLADGIIVGLYEYLAPMKASALKDFEKAVIFPLSDVCFGPCTDELTEVIKIANHERRMQGDRFISVKHILFGLSFSRVGECVERILNDRGLNCLGVIPSKLSSFSIYKLLRDATTILGLRNRNTECGVESFDDSDAFKSLLPEDCLDAAGKP